eukprot:6197751-Pleurochrysis_carterae.AAC.3
MEAQFWPRCVRECRAHRPAECGRTASPQAQVMNTEIAEHEERRASQTSVALVDASAPSAEAPADAPADAPAEQSDSQRALAESEALSCVTPTAPATAETPSH